MKKVMLNVTTTTTEVFTCPLDNDAYTAVLTMAADGASDDEIADFLQEHADHDNPIEDYEKTKVNAVCFALDDENHSHQLFNTSEGDEA